MDESSGDRADSVGAFDLLVGFGFDSPSGVTGHNDLAAYSGYPAQCLITTNSAVLPTDGAPNYTAVDYTVALWFKYNGSIDGATAFASDRWSVDIINSGTQLQLAVPGVGAATVPGTLSAGTWYLAAVKHDAAANTLSVSLNDGTFYTVSGIDIGDTESSITYCCRAAGTAQIVVDEVACWSGLISSADLTTLYNGGTGTFYGAGTAPVAVTSSSVVATLDRAGPLEPVPVTSSSVVASPQAGPFTPLAVTSSSVVAMPYAGVIPDAVTFGSVLLRSSSFSAVTLT